MFKKESLSPGTPTETGKMTAEIIVSAFNEIGCHAFSPGSKDFAAGKDYLIEMSNGADFPFISCNIYNNQSGQLLFHEYQIKDINGLERDMSMIVTHLITKGKSG